MSIICPTVTWQRPDAHEYRQQMERVEYLAPRIQVDLMDGVFAPTKSPPLDHLWFPEHLTVDVHLMYKHPADVLNEMIDLRPHLFIVHAEAEVDIATLAIAVHEAGIKLGLALLKETPPSDILDELQFVDHVLIFSGDLGHFGGAADLSLLAKVTQLKNYRPELEIGWDGGANADTVASLARGGVDVINVGSYIQLAEDPKRAYDELTRLVQS